jgi:hypothetical protein
MQQGRQKKLMEKQKMAGGMTVQMPEVFVSNYMKQQRNFVHYKRLKKVHTPLNMPAEVIAAIKDRQQIAVPKAQRVPLNCLLMLLRVKESRNTTP